MSLKDKTRKEILDETIQAAIENRFPFEQPPGSVTSPSGVGHYATHPPVGPDIAGRPLVPAVAAPDAPRAPSTAGPIFEPDAELYAPLPNRFEWFTMPGRGGRLCIHPASIEDGLWISQQVMREFEEAGVRLPQVGPGSSPETIEVYHDTLKRIQREEPLRTAVWHCIAVCRRGESLKDAKVFSVKHARALRQNPGWMEAVGHIWQTSVRLSSGAAEAELLREVYAGFFGCMGDWLGMLSSRLNAGSAECCAKILAGFARCASSMKARGGLSESDLDELRGLMDELPQ